MHDDILKNKEEEMIIVVINGSKSSYYLLYPMINLPNCFFLWLPSSLGVLDFDSLSNEANRGSPI